MTNDNHQYLYRSWFAKNSPNGCKKIAFSSQKMASLSVFTVTLLSIMSASIYASPTLIPIPSPTVYNIPTPLPSSAPSALPSLVPVPAPTTNDPTPLPSSAPSLLPSSLPTSPTLFPAPSPTILPVPAPTMVPIPSPTVEPVPAPTMVPIPSPTTVPVPFPTLVPIPSPTKPPTTLPSALPSSLPSSLPTFAPSSIPTRVIGVPTMAPIPLPTTVPTMMPIPSPTILPVSTPTIVPLPIPTMVPIPSPTTKQPSSLPSALPSSLPTPEPSLSVKDPTTSPTMIPHPSPTSLPTAPTFMPTIAPSIILVPTTSANPSSLPSPMPTSSRRPTPLPSPLPTTTLVPSLRPTARPTLVPTSPTSLPTLPPSHAPSSLPIPQPSVVPVPAPTASPTAPSFYPSGSPSVIPSPVPTFPPTTQDTVTVGVDFTLNNVPEDTTEDNIILKNLVYNITGLPDGAIKRFTVVDTSLLRRSRTRQLLTNNDTWQTNFLTTVSLSEMNESSAEALIGDIVTELNSDVFTSEIAEVFGGVVDTSSTTGYVAMPTSQPTSLPVFNPTPLPSVRPSMLPTNQPTLPPSLGPSSQPTPLPNSLPVPSPTLVPIPIPTSVPVPVPTSVPNSIPTRMPVTPTSLPTSSPTASPTPRGGGDGGTSNSGLNAASISLIAIACFLAVVGFCVWFKNQGKEKGDLYRQDSMAEDRTPEERPSGLELSVVRTGEFDMDAAAFRGSYDEFLKVDDQRRDYNSNPLHKKPQGQSSQRSSLSDFVANRLSAFSTMIMGAGESVPTYSLADVAKARLQKEQAEANGTRNVLDGGVMKQNESYQVDHGRKVTSFSNLPVSKDAIDFKKSHSNDIAVVKRDKSFWMDDFQQDEPSDSAGGGVGDQHRRQSSNSISGRISDFTSMMMMGRKSAEEEGGNDDVELQRRLPRKSFGELADKQFVAVSSVVNNKSLSLVEQLERLSSLGLSETDFEFAKKYALTMVKPPKQFTPDVPNKPVDQSRHNVGENVGEIENDKQFMAVNSVVNDQNLTIVEKLDRLSKLNLSGPDFENAKKFALAMTKPEKQFTPSLQNKEIDRSEEERASTMRTSVGEIDNDKQFMAVNSVVNDMSLNLVEKLDRLSKIGLSKKDFENAKRFCIAMSKTSTGTTPVLPQARLSETSSALMNAIPEQPSRISETSSAMMNPVHSNSYHEEEEEEDITEEEESSRNMDAMVSAPVTMEGIEAAARRASMVNPDDNDA